MKTPPGTPIDVLAAEVLAMHRIDPVPPIDVRRLARAMGVESITRESMVEDGRLEHRPGNTRIFLSADSHPARERFTLAHELGHLLLARPDVPLTARRLQPAMSSEERFCDAFAAALLMPVAWIRARGAGRAPSLALASAMAADCGCSLSSLVIRMNEILRWRRALLTWRRERDSWRWVAAAGIPRSLHGDLRSTPETAAVLNAQTRSGEARVRLPFKLGDKVVYVPTELKPTKRGLVALVELDAFA